MDKSELPEEITALIEKADSGDAPAQFELGEKYHKGQGVEQSNSKAVEWFRKAAKQGHARSQNAMGHMYKYALGVEQNDSEALVWYRKSAEQGWAPAQYNLGTIYLDGKLIEQSDSEAVAWYRKAAEQGDPDAQCNLGWMYENGRGLEKNIHEAVDLYQKAAANGSAVAQFNLALCYMEGRIVEKNYSKALDLCREAASAVGSEVRFESIELQDEIERKALSLSITNIRSEILNQLKVDSEKTPTMTHYTSLSVGSDLLLAESPLRLGHIKAFNDPNEGRILWRMLGHSPVESKPVFVGCFLPDDDSLNMWRFYSKNHNNDDACGCAITFNTEKFFEFNLLQSPQIDAHQDEPRIAFSNTGRSPQESTAFYRIIYINNDNEIHGNDEAHELTELFVKLKNEVDLFLSSAPENEKLQQLSRLLGPLPYLIKNSDYEAEKEHRIIVTHLEYGASEIKFQEPDMKNGIPKTPPKLYLELYRTHHLGPVKHVTLGPKAPHQEMIAPYWHHKLASDFASQLKPKPDFYIRTSKCAYK
ncbi:DUF2971 domain-containing protein [Aeromonas sp. sia0103]|uniref:DUF2971 domain-containing protein n=1 Tax=Aeromonas sp. sia0103 TaxID=2854782 RepID=UPI001C474004|nr:DUF2971 domain-containing protein [Aeromonas sp. sia0103]MBV7598944.1 SEL1-like repeat protein [Aeromonas sp. sia0103]